MFSFGPKWIQQKDTDTLRKGETWRFTFDATDYWLQDPGQEILTIRLRVAEAYEEAKATDEMVAKTSYRSSDAYWENNRLYVRLVVYVDENPIPAFVIPVAILAAIFAGTVYITSVSYAKSADATGRNALSLVTVGIVAIGAMLVFGYVFKNKSIIPK